MDKETLSNYGWIVICVLVLAVMLALATPFGQFVSNAVKSTTQGLFDVNQNALNSTGLINIGDQSFDENQSNGGNDEYKLSEFGLYYNRPYAGREDRLDDFLVCLTFYENGTCSYTDISGDGYHDMPYKTTTLEGLINLLTGSQEIPEEELEEVLAYFAEMGITKNTTIITISNGEETEPLCAVLSKTEIRTFISDCNIFTCEGEEFTTIGEYGYMINRTGDGYVATVIDRTKTEYQPVETTILGKPVELTNTYTGCDNLKSIVIPSGVTIGYHAFYSCESLENVTISSGVEIIGEGAFLGCTALETVTIPASITRIEQSAFALFLGHPRNGTLKVYYEGTIEQWNNIPENSLLSNLANSDIGGPTELYINGVLVN